MRMADEKSKIVTDATGPDAGPAPVQPEVGGGTPAPKQLAGALLRLWAFELIFRKERRYDQT